MYLCQSEFLANLSSKTVAFPTSEDLTGAAEALLRLQDTYALSTTKVARGDLMGVRDSPHMTGQLVLPIVAYNYQRSGFRVRAIVNRTKDAVFNRTISTFGVGADKKKTWKIMRLFQFQRTVLLEI